MTESLPNDDVHPFSRDKVEIVVRPTRENGGHGVMRDRATGKETPFWRDLAYEEYLKQRRKLEPQVEAAWRVRLADLRLSLALPVADAERQLALKRPAKGAIDPERYARGRHYRVIFCAMCDLLGKLKWRVQRLAEHDADWWAVQGNRTSDEIYEGDQGKSP